jgi:hypothetical protein
MEKGGQWLKDTKFWWDGVNRFWRALYPVVTAVINSGFLKANKINQVGSKEQCVLWTFGTIKYKHRSHIFLFCFLSTQPYGIAVMGQQWPGGQITDSTRIWLLSKMTGLCTESENLSKGVYVFFNIAMCSWEDTKFFPPTLKIQRVTHTRAYEWLSNFQY